LLTIDGYLAEYGTLQIDLAGTTPIDQYDRLVVTGTATLGGTLEVNLLDGFTPSAGQSFDVLDFGGVTGTFSQFDLPGLDPGLAWDLSALYTDGVLSVTAFGPGDFNADGKIDGRDFLAWQRSPAVGNLADWQVNYGNGSLASSRAVPEPTSWALLVAILPQQVLGRRRI
jgi:hypothetical protein